MDTIGTVQTFFFLKQYLLFNQALKISEYFKDFKKHFLPILNLINLLFCPLSAQTMKVERTEYYYQSMHEKAEATEIA